MCTSTNGSPTPTSASRRTTDEWVRPARWRFPPNHRFGPCVRSTRTPRGCSADGTGGRRGTTRGNPAAHQRLQGWQNRRCPAPASRGDRDSDRAIRQQRAAQDSSLSASRHRSIGRAASGGAQADQRRGARRQASRPPARRGIEGPRRVRRCRRGPAIVPPAASRCRVLPTASLPARAAMQSRERRRRQRPRTPLEDRRRRDDRPGCWSRPAMNGPPAGPRARCRLQPLRERMPHPGAPMPHPVRTAARPRCPRGPGQPVPRHGVLRRPGVADTGPQGGRCLDPVGTALQHPERRRTRSVSAHRQAWARRARLRPG